MWRLASVFMIGVALGAVGVYLKSNGEAETGVTSALDFSAKRNLVSSPSHQSPDQAASTVGGFSERAAAYRLADHANLDSLHAMIEEAAARPESMERRYLLETLVSKYAESSPHEALSLVEELELDTSILAALYRSWASHDPDAALDAWHLADDPREAQAIGLAMFAGLGGDQQALSILATSPPPILEPEYFLPELIGLWATYAPRAAFDETLSLDRKSTRSNALREVARAWAARDPRAALDALVLMDDRRLRNSFRSTVIRGWSSFDPERALEYLMEQRNPDDGDLYHALTRVAGSDPERALELATRLRGEHASLQTELVVGVWAGNDPKGALAYAESLPAGKLRDDLRQATVHTFAMQDPEGAIVWVQGLDPPVPRALDTVIGGVALVDPARALDILLSLESKQAQLQSAGTVAERAGYSDRPEVLAEKLGEVEDSDVKRELIKALIRPWASRDPESALTWFLANPDEAGESAFRKISKDLGKADPETAAKYTATIPSEHRQAWIENVASGYVQADSHAAFAWVRQFEGEPGYESALASMLSYSARHDPQAAARELEAVLDSPRAASAASSIAEHWFLEDPRGAATWAQELDNEEARSAAISGLARQWGRTDYRATARWAMSLDSAPDKDVALEALLPEMAEKETPDEDLLNAFTSDVIRSQAVSSIVYKVAKRDPDAARRMIDEHVSEPHLRRNAERMLAAAQGDR